MELYLDSPLRVYGLHWDGLRHFVSFFCLRPCPSNVVTASDWQNKLCGICRLSHTPYMLAYPRSEHCSNNKIKYSCTFYLPVTKFFFFCRHLFLSRRIFLVLFLNATNLRYFFCGEGPYQETQISWRLFTRPFLRVYFAPIFATTNCRSERVGTVRRTPDI